MLIIINYKCKYIKVFFNIATISSSDDIEFNTKVIKGVIKEDIQIYKKGCIIQKINSSGVKRTGN